MVTNTKIKDFKINQLTEEQYKNAKANNELNENELYLTTDDNVNDGNNNGINSTILFDNSLGLNGTITLNDSAENYNRLDIFFRNNNDFYNSVSILNPDKKYVALNIAIPWNTDQSIWEQGVIKYINGTTISNNGAYYGEAQVMGTSFNANDNIFITRVIGYK